MKKCTIGCIALIIATLLTLTACSQITIPSSSQAMSVSETPQQDTEHLDEIYEKYVQQLNPNSGITSYSWATPNDISADDLVDFCIFNDLLNLKINGEYEGDGLHAPAEKVEAAILQYFDGISPEYLRTSQWYEYDKVSGQDFSNEYIMMIGGGGGSTKVLNAEQTGNLLRIVVGFYIGDDLDKPEAIFLLTVRLEESGFKYLSYVLHQ